LILTAFVPRRTCDGRLSVIADNGSYGVDSLTTNTFYTYGDNRINGNGAADVVGGLNA
jgi:hypothetical protein